MSGDKMFFTIVGMIVCYLGIAVYLIGVVLSAFMNIVYDHGNTPIWKSLALSIAWPAIFGYMGVCYIKDFLTR